jgi:gamma-glutamyltranspeptidase/glutathione hydrolase
MAVDSEGNAAILVESIFTLFGSGVFDAETGILLNNRMRGFSFDPGSSNVLAAGKRPAHTLSPFLLLQDGALRMVLGSPGGPGQTITLVQAITNHIDRGLSMTQAIAEPRWSYDLDRRVILEQGVSDAVAVALGELSIKTIRPPSETPYFGSVKAITVDGDGYLHGFTDPRREAAAGGR